jgi:DNA-binding transcriptional MerR regulator
MDGLLKISEAARRLNIAPATLRVYAEKGLVPVVKLPSGHRRFKPEDVQRLRREWGLDPADDDSGKEQDA